MQIPPIPQPVQDSNLTISSRSTVPLHVGEIVQAEVLTVTDTAAAIRMKSSILEARTNVPLREGETITLIVEGRGDEIRLRLLRGGEGDALSIKNSILAALTTLKGLRPAAEDVRLLINLANSMPPGVKELLPGLSVLEKLMMSLEGLTGGALKTAVQNSGAYFETKLRLLVQGEGQDGFGTDQKLQAMADNDLKAALLSLRHGLENSDVVNRLLQNNVRTDTLTAAVDNLLKNLELLQLQSKLSDTLQVFVPFIWQELKNGELIFRESQHEQSGEEAYSCTLNLNLERAGRMSARLLLQTGQVHVDVSAENGRFFGLLQEGAALLREQFETAGIKLGTLTIRQQPEIDFKMSEAGGLNIRV